MYITKSIKNIFNKSNTLVKTAMKKGVRSVKHSVKRSLKGGYINTTKKSVKSKTSKKSIKYSKSVRKLSTKNLSN
jgi:hypothetical protein